MKVSDIKIGMKVKLTGDTHGCGITKCKDCLAGCKLKVRGIDMDDNSDGRVVVVEWGDISHNHNCLVHPDDLSPVEITNWRGEFE